jgi:mannose/fructose/N-acetylgalactosamine-specific phosphotransferase system component IIC
MTAFDHHMVQMVLVAALLGGLIGLDRTALGQFMVSQPVVAGPLVGWVFGDVTSGLVIGGVLELIWVLDLPIGTFVPADSTIAAVAATAIDAIGGGAGGDLSMIGFSLLLTVIMVPVTMFADQLMRKRNRQIPELAAGGKGGPTEAVVSFWHLAGILAFFLKGFVLTLGFVTAGTALALWFTVAPAVYHRAMTIFVMFLPLLGVASMARKLSMNLLDRSLIVGFLIGAVCVLLFRSPVLVAVLLATAGGWVEVRARGV